MVTEEEPVWNLGKVAEFLRRLTSAPLETEEVRTLARAERASDRSLPRNDGRYGSAISWRWVNEDREEDNHGCEGRGDEAGEKESVSSLSLSSSTAFRESTDPEEEERLGHEEKHQ